MSITWQHDCIELLRVMINDLSDTEPIYSDSRLARVLVVAAFQLNTEVDFTQEYTIDLSQQLISPDPTDLEGQTRNDNFVNLMCLKAACIIDTGSAVLAAQNAMSVKDMVFQADLRGVADSTLALLKEGWCKTYKEVVDDYLYGTTTACAAVMGPFRTIAFQHGRPHNYYSYNERGY